MAGSSAARSDPTILSRWTRDYRLSLGLFVTGIVMVLAIAVFGSWASSSFWTGLAVHVLGTAGGMLVIVSGIFAFHNWSLLRQSRRIT